MTMLAIWKSGDHYDPNYGALATVDRRLISMAPAGAAGWETVTTTEDERADPAMGSRSQPAGTPRNVR